MMAVDNEHVGGRCARGVVCVLRVGKGFCFHNDIQILLTYTVILLWTAR